MVAGFARDLHAFLTKARRLTRGEEFRPEKRGLAAREVGRGIAGDRWR
jgi:hypothetical protein